MPARIRRRRLRGWRMPAGAVYVGRPTKWGNVFLPAEDPDLSRYRAYLKTEIATGRLNLEELRGRDLACWCRLDRPCHADVLLELSNQNADDGVSRDGGRA